MRKETVAEFQEKIQHVRQELLGEWYNYEPKDAVLTGRQIDHWLSLLEEPLQSSPPRSKV